jgi:hypothetical protein
MSARSDLELLVPRRVAKLMERTFRAVRRAEGQDLSDEECLVKVAEHFIRVTGSGCRQTRPPLRRTPRGAGIGVDTHPHHI